MEKQVGESAGQGAGQNTILLRTPAGISRRGFFGRAACSDDVLTLDDDVYQHCSQKGSRVSRPKPGPM